MCCFRILVIGIWVLFVFWDLKFEILFFP